jgi:hypothetical protein
MDRRTGRVPDGRSSVTRRYFRIRPYTAFRVFLASVLTIYLPNSLSTHLHLNRISSRNNRRSTKRSGRRGCGMLRCLRPRQRKRRQDGEFGSLALDLPRSLHRPSDLSLLFLPLPAFVSSLLTSLRHSLFSLPGARLIPNFSAPQERTTKQDRTRLQPLCIFLNPATALLDYQSLRRTCSGDERERCGAGQGGSGA